MIMKYKTLLNYNYQKKKTTRTELEKNHFPVKKGEKESKLPVKIFTLLGVRSSLVIVSVQAKEINTITLSLSLFLASSCSPSLSSFSLSVLSCFQFC